MFNKNSDDPEGHLKFQNFCDKKEVKIELNAKIDVTPLMFPSMIS